MRRGVIVFGPLLAAFMLAMSGCVVLPPPPATYGGSVPAEADDDDSSVDDDVDSTPVGIYGDHVDDETGVYMGPDYEPIGPSDDDDTSLEPGEP